MKRLVVGILLSLLVGVACVGQTSLFDRAAFVEQVRELFQPLEAYLNDGDQFNYDELAFFSAVLNGWEEHVVVVPLTLDSPSTVIGQHLGEDLSWADVGPLPICGFLVLSPTDCIHTLVPDVPYLIRGRAWDRSELIDAEGTFTRYFTTYWLRGASEGAWYTFRGNIEFHAYSCAIMTSNQK